MIVSIDTILARNFVNMRKCFTFYCGYNWEIICFTFYIFFRDIYKFMKMKTLTKPNPHNKYTTAEN